jgi:hypothetical protein
MFQAVAIALASLALTAGEASAPDAPRPLKVSYLYNLSNTQGDVPSNFATISYDPKNDELYVVSRESRAIRIFNEAGMEIHKFGGDLTLGWVRGVVALENGELLALSSVEDGATALIRCDFRGQVIERVQLKNIPASLGGFGPDVLHAALGKVYLLDSKSMKVVVIDYDGNALASYDLHSLVFGKNGPDLSEFSDRNPDDDEIQGFSVDRKGNILFTIPTLFRAFVVTTDHKISSFGQKGSRPGKFNLAGPIAADERGYIYIADMLRCVVMVFDENHTFVTEFGGRGLSPGRLVLPSAMVVGNDKIFVSQARNRGVAVFRASW